MQVFYAIQERKEYTQRVLQLTQDLIMIASSFYSVWQYRWECLMALNDSLDGEWELCLQVLDQSPKNYQLFNHRRKCFDYLFKPGNTQVARRELEFAETAIDRDSKNYHAWSHRWYVLKVSNDDHLLRQEISYIEDRLRDDPFNNSAWNHRFAIFQNFQYITDVSQEVKYAIKMVDHAPSNESVWVYIQGLLRSCDFEINIVEKVCECCQRVLQGEGRYTQAINTVGKIAERSHLQDVGVKVYRSLSKIDPIRQGYWESKVQAFKQVQQ
eukprot:TRINITY_DN8925_c0_g4_i2.p1 TRINITY_DN8925_c0_g4~~TRINITY_DN8925_c0_g4_i2.p1  ORF type:complete len:269 (+),score=18.22 TRINITY_DN8925_c0_g4_i2:307-1113(+)